MLINFFLTLRKYKVPATVRELMDLLEGLKQRLVYSDVDDFYLLSRTTLCKDEKNYDKFDRAFAAYFKGITLIMSTFLCKAMKILATQSHLEASLQV